MFTIRNFNSGITLSGSRMNPTDIRHEQETRHGHGNQLVSYHRIHSILSMDNLFTVGICF